MVVYAHMWGGEAGSVARLAETPVLLQDAIFNDRATFL